MFKFMKNFIKVQETVSLENLGSWISEKEKPDAEKIDKEAKRWFSEFNEIIESLKSEISELENAELKEPVEEKVKQIVIGHRTTYMRLVKQYLFSIKIPERTDYLQLLKFSAAIDERLNEFSQQSAKSYYATQHLFADSVERCAGRIKKLSELSKEITEGILKTKLIRLDEVMKALELHTDLKAEKDELKKSLSLAEEKIREAEKHKQEVTAELAALKGAEEFKHYLEINNELETVLNEQKSVKNRIIGLFSPLDSGFKKMEHDCPDDPIVKSYASDPVTALIADKELKIIGILQKMKSMILSDKLDLRDRKKQNAADAIETISAVLLNGIANQYNTLKGRETAIRKEIRLNDVALKVKDYEYKLDHYINSVAQNRQRAGKLKESFEKINLEQSKKQIEEKLKEIGYDVIVS